MVMGRISFQQEVAINMSQSEYSFHGYRASTNNCVWEVVK